MKFLNTFDNLMWETNFAPSEIQNRMKFKVVNYYIVKICICLSLFYLTCICINLGLWAGLDYHNKKLEQEIALGTQNLNISTESYKSEKNILQKLRLDWGIYPVPKNILTWFDNLTNLFKVFPLAGVGFNQIGDKLEFKCVIYMDPDADKLTQNKFFTLMEKAKEHGTLVYESFTQNSVLVKITKNEVPK